MTLYDDFILLDSETAAMKTEYDEINSPRCQLAESPLWDSVRRVLYWSDIPAGRVWSYQPHSGQTQLLWQGDMQVGGLALNKGGGLVLCGDRGIFLGWLDENGVINHLKELFAISLGDDERFNDVIADSVGRLLAGTLKGSRRDGRLYRLERGGKPVVVLEGIGNSNGMAFSGDGRHFYHTDSQVRTITRYDYDAGNGGIANPQLYYQGDPADGKPDGITIDAEDCIWAACYYGRQIIRLDRQGQIIDRLALPAANVTSVMFGGDDLGDLYITTARNKQELPADGGGMIYRYRPARGGRTEFQTEFE